MHNVRWLKGRAEAELRAARIVEQYEGPVMRMVAQAVRDLAPETADMGQVEADLRLAGLVAERLDNAIYIPNELAEAIDRPIFFFVALSAIGVWRGLQRKEKNRASRMARLEALLADHGPELSARRRRAVERRVRRLKDLIGDTA
jgi:hypothetical protein